MTKAASRPQPVNVTLKDLGQYEHQKSVNSNYRWVSRLEHIVKGTLLLALACAVLAGFTAIFAAPGSPVFLGTCLGALALFTITFFVRKKQKTLNSEMATTLGQAKKGGEAAATKSGILTYITTLLKTLNKDRKTSEQKPKATKLLWPHTSSPQVKGNPSQERQGNDDDSLAKAAMGAGKKLWSAISNNLVESILLGTLLCACFSGGLIGLIVGASLFALVGSWYSSRGNKLNGQDVYHFTHYAEGNRPAEKVPLACKANSNTTKEQPAWLNSQQKQTLVQPSNIPSSCPKLAKTRNDHFARPKQRVFLKLDDQDHPSDYEVTASPAATSTA
jgi:hypothetical protein